MIEQRAVLKDYFGKLKIPLVIGGLGGLAVAGIIVGREPLRQYCAVDSNPNGSTWTVPDGFGSEPIPSDHNDLTDTERLKHIKVFAILGAGATFENSRALKHTLNSTYGENNVQVWNSGLLSKDPVEVDEEGNIDRDRIIGESLIPVFESDDEARIILVSGGVPEFTKALDAIEVMRPGFFEDRKLDNVTIALVSPAGLFEDSPSGKVCYIDRLVELALAAGNASSVNEVIESLITFPPKNISVEALIDALRNIYTNASQVTQERTHPIPIAPFESNNDYWPVLDSEAQNELARIDDRLAAFIEQKNFEEIRQLLIARSGVIEPYREAMYRGDYFEGDAESPLNPIDTSNSLLRKLQVWGSIAEEGFSGDAVVRLRRLYDENGVVFIIVVPEFDIQGNIGESSARFERRAPSLILEMTPHTALITQTKWVNQIFRSQIGQ